MDDGGSGDRRGVWCPAAARVGLSPPTGISAPSSARHMSQGTSHKPHPWLSLTHPLTQCPPLMRCRAAMLLPAACCRTVAANSRCACPAYASTSPSYALVGVWTTGASAPGLPVSRRSTRGLAWSEGRGAPPLKPAA